VAGVAGSGTYPLDVIVNGRFDKPLNTGWTVGTDDILGSHGIRTESGGVRVSKEMRGITSLTQEVRVESLTMGFMTYARLSSRATDSGHYSAASILLTYLGENGDSLGATRVYNATGNTPWQNSGTLHLVPVVADSWQLHKLMLLHELTENLRDIDPAKVKRLRVSLESFCSGGNAWEWSYQSAEVFARLVSLHPLTRMHG
jgi:hypothetical protein